METIVRLAITSETRKRLRQIASFTDETLYKVIERLAIAEQQRIGINTEKEYFSHAAIFASSSND